ncbi:MAG: hypothetical protein ABI134_31985 [Byssovorax sp.]
MVKDSGIRFMREGPFRAEQFSPRDPYELSHGHALRCLPTGGRGGERTLAGGAALATDPAVKSAGVDVGFSPEPGMLRAPDVAVGNVPNEPGWVRGVPPLAVEYADIGQDEPSLQDKIVDLLSAGTKLIWVVRLMGARRVEVYEKGAAVRVVGDGEDLLAPGILQNPVPVAVLFDPEAAYRVTLRNLLQREGYESVDAIRDEGRDAGRLEGFAQAILSVLEARGISVEDRVRAAILGCAEVPRLTQWLARATTAVRADDVIG